MSRAVYVYRPGHPKADQWNMVDMRDLGEEPTALAIDAPFMVGRFYENTCVVGTGEDIGSRTKHREYMKRNGLTTADDFTKTWAKAEKEREQMRQGIFPDRRERREEIGRIHYEVEKRERKRK